jgi:hypothetical protein
MAGSRYGEAPAATQPWPRVGDEEHRVETGETDGLDQLEADLPEPADPERAEPDPLVDDGWLAP